MVFCAAVLRFSLLFSHFWRTDVKKRIPYIAGFIVLLIAEVLIALFVHDSFVRPYMGDIIVVWVVYCLAMIFLSGKCSPFAVIVGVFGFACITELLQAIDIVKLLGLGDNAFFRTLIGTSFDIKDIICYAAGSLLLAAAVIFRRKTVNRN